MTINPRAQVEVHLLGSVLIRHNIEHFRSRNEVSIARDRVAGREPLCAFAASFLGNRMPPDIKASVTFGSRQRSRWARECAPLTRSTLPSGVSLRGMSS